MKQLLIISLWLSILFRGFGQGVLLNTGDSYAYQFSSLPFGGFSTSGNPRAYFSLPIFPSDLGPSGTLRFEMFEDTPNGIPIFSRTLTMSSSIWDTDGTVPNAWADIQGSIRLTMLSGSIAINVFSLQAMIPAGTSGFNVYGGRVYPIPEPSALSFLVFGFQFILETRRKRNENHATMRCI